MTGHSDDLPKELFGAALVILCIFLVCGFFETSSLWFLDVEEVCPEAHSRKSIYASIGQGDTRRLQTC
jgi:hypothetical protein